MKIIAVIALVLMSLCIPGINIYHHITLPPLNKYRIIEHTDFIQDWFNPSHHYDITLEDTVVDSYFYEDVSKVLREATSNDTITFHLYGFGGREDTMYLLINQVKDSKAIVTMSVEAPVYSALAYLAVSGNYLKMAPYTYLMFHFSTVINEDCNSETGTDRGVSNVEHCWNFYNTDVYTGQKLVNSINLLTIQEKASIETGHDVYLTPEQVYSRVHNGIL